MNGYSSETNISKLAGQTSVEISNLEALSLYEVKLSAIDSQGGEVLTQPFKWRTGDASKRSSPNFSSNFKQIN